ncbi:IS200/IS605 family transposase [Streptomyces sp. NPDC002917]|uniref:IS200/IS605 family transposase n=1 Tax=Streptomyces sp. NPDC002917 TaxID=3364671 RepID=UPI00369E094C
MFVTKYRRDVFDDAMLRRCEVIKREVCAGFGTELREFNGEADHVHLLVHYPPKVALSKLIQLPQGRQLPVPAGRIHQSHQTDRHGSVFWSRSYFPGSCGGAPLTAIRQYIESQKRPV